MRAASERHPGALPSHAGTPFPLRKLRRRRNLTRATGGDFAPSRYPSCAGGGTERADGSCAGGVAISQREKSMNRSRASAANEKGEIEMNEKPTGATIA